MKIEKDQYRLSPTDLADYLACRHLTGLSRKVARGELERPRDYDPRVEVLAERGRRHETQYLDWLREEGGLDVVEIEERGAGSGAFRATLEQMEAGVDVIAQGTLAHGRWRGRPDVLRRVERPSDLGAWSYEAVDTKLARQTRGTTILQLCAYSGLLEEIQGVQPKGMYVVSPGHDFEPEVHKVTDYSAYFERIRGAFEGEIALAPGTRETYPDPVEHCEICAWWKRCDARRREDDHLCLVAGMSGLHQRELEEWGVTTRSELAGLPLPIERRPERGSRATYERLREQARLQVTSPPEGEGPPRYERLPVEPEVGLSRLPEPSPGDLFLDLEGDPFAGPEGQEYLFGWVTLDDGGEPEYHSLWAPTRGQERAAFEELVDEMMERWARWEEFHVYHFGHYEPSALKRLMGRYATRQDEIDRLLRGKRFVDLYGVVRQGLRVGVESYSIKKLEPLYSYQRDLDLREASKTLFRVEVALERGAPDEITPEDREQVESYNRDDCVSTLRLRSWLEEVQARAIGDGESIPRPPLKEGEPSEKLTEWQERVRPVRERLHTGLPDDPEAWNADERARWILGHLLEFHHRENKVDWWELFRLAEMPEDERYDEPKAIAGMEHERRMPRTGKGGRELLPIDRYTFPVQEIDERGKTAKLDEDTSLGSIEEISGTEGFVAIRKSRETKDLHPTSVFMFSWIPTETLEDSLLRLAHRVVGHGIEGPGPDRAARDLLLRRPPRLRPGSRGLGPRDGEDPLTRARRLALELDRGVLPIQGPPGTGKTFTGARMILELVKAGKRVGITALSHRVIQKLLDETVEAAQLEGIQTLRCIRKIKRSETPVDRGPMVEETKSTPKVRKALEDGDVQVAASTAWLWASEEMFESVDVLFVDEAAQLSLANTLAAAPAADSLVLIGDPQQLEQPIQGTHPEGAGVAALEHLLGEHETLPPEKGLFLEETWRLHPSICDFTSKLYYEGRLDPRPKNRIQALHAPKPFDACGLYFVPVEHEGNQSVSDEEVGTVVALVEGWRDGGAEWTDKEGVRMPLTLEEILIVAPYNVQVSRLKERLPAGARVGTVDKFQGQQAPVVVYSMTSSSPEDAPRGMEFLYSRHRLNVATSRARCAVVLVASPELLEPECRTPRQMRLANGLCAFVKRAKLVG